MSQTSTPTTLRSILDRAARETGVDLDDALEEIASAAERELGPDPDLADRLETTARVASNRIDRDPAFDRLASALLRRRLRNRVTGTDPAPDERAAIYREQFRRGIERGIDAERLDPALADRFDLDRLADALRPARDDQLGYMAVETLRQRYLLRTGPDVTPFELPQTFWMRVAMGLALEESDPTARALEFYRRGRPSASGLDPGAVHCCDTLGFDPDHLYGMYDRVPSIEEKDQFVVDLTQSIDDDGFSIADDADVRALLRDLVGFYVVMEGIFFYAGFAMILNLKRRSKMVGLGQQFEYIMRDESLHVGFGVDLIDAICREHPDAWTEAFGEEVLTLVRDAVDLEAIYAREACPPDVPGMDADSFVEYVEYVADRRLGQLDLPEQYGTQNPFPWMSEQADLNKEKNFFETQVTEYRSGGALEW